MDDEVAEKRNIRVQVRRNSDGAVSSAVWEEWMWYPRAYWWTEGNASCDCNRETFFTAYPLCPCWETKKEADREGMGLEKPDFVERGDGRFDVHITDADTGEVLYSEFEEWSAKGVLKKLTDEVWALEVMGDASEKEAHEAITDVIRILREAGRIWDYKRIVMNLRDLRRVWPIIRESSDGSDQSTEVGPSMKDKGGK